MLRQTLTFINFMLVSTTRPPQVVGRFFCALSNQECTTQLL